ILKPGGWVALMWNERDEVDPFTAAYGAVIRTAPDSAAVEGSRGRAGLALLESPLYETGEQVSFGYAQSLDEDGMFGRALSASYAPREPEAVAKFTAGLRAAFARFQHEGRVVLRYVTTVYSARRRD